MSPKQHGKIASEPIMEAPSLFLHGSRLLFGIRLPFVRHSCLWGTTHVFDAGRRLQACVSGKRRKLNSPAFRLINESEMASCKSGDRNAQDFIGVHMKFTRVHMNSYDFI